MSVRSIDVVRGASVAAASLAFGVFELVVYPIVHPECMRVAGLERAFSAESCAGSGWGLWLAWAAFTAAAAFVAFRYLKIGRERAR